MPVKFSIDEDAHKKLIEIKEKMKKEGIENPSFSDVIRYLYNKYKTETLHKKKYQSFSDIVDQTISENIKQQVEVCIREYKDPKDKDFYGFFIIGEGEGLFSPRFYTKEELMKELMKWVDKLIH